MKNLVKYIAVGLAAVSVASCADLDTEYLGNYVSADQKADAHAAKPELGTSGVTAITGQFYLYGQVSENHFDFGYPGIMIGLDSQTADFNGGNSGYNWFRNWQMFSNPTPTGIPTAMAWYHMYKQIKLENDLLASIDPETTDATNLFYMAQGLAVRSFNYWVLANLYAFNYQVDATAPCVPIITEKNQEEASINGCPRASVKEVYDQIFADIDLAITSLEKSGLQPSAIIASKSKRLVSLAVAYGLRARYNMSIGNYAAAASDAQNAINNFNGSPYTIQQLMRPGFTNIDDQSWMWGIATAETDRVVTTGIVNFPSHICSLAYGYTEVGGWRYCSQDLYNQIPNTDVRKGWFLNESFTSDHLNAAEQEYINNYVGAWTLEETQKPFIYPYTNVKYGTYQDVIEQSTNASDIPMMRVEEMYLILAEAQAMSGNPGAGKTTLETLIRTYRNPAYTCSASDAAGIQEEVFQQKRVELWGEGLMWFDYMRLNKGVNRLNAMAPSAFRFDMPAGSPQFIYCIPNGEITANKQISDADNNPSSSRPIPVPNN